MPEKEPTRLELGYVSEDFVHYLKIKASKLSIRANLAGQQGDRLGVMANGMARIALKIVESLIVADLIELNQKQEDADK